MTSWRSLTRLESLVLLRRSEQLSAAFPERHAVNLDPRAADVQQRGVTMANNELRGGDRGDLSGAYRV